MIVVLFSDKKAVASLEGAHNVRKLVCSVKQWQSRKMNENTKEEIQ